MTPAYTPYDGTSKPFTIGVKPMALGSWLEVDAALEPYLAEKDRLLVDIPDKVFVARDDTADAQDEVLALVLDDLEAHHAETHVRGEDRVTIGTRAVALDAGGPALKTAARLVQEDLVLMRKCADGWRLVAASLSFPSSWSLQEKYDRPLDAIHAPVPGFGAGTRMADLIARMFDNLRVEQPVERMNWSLQGNADLYHPHSHQSRIARAEGRIRDISPEANAARTFMRVERQTLRRLLASGDILFTIRIYLDPLAVLAGHEDRVRIAGNFAHILQAMSQDQLAYKGLAIDRDRLVEALNHISRN